MDAELNHANNNGFHSVGSMMSPPNPSQRRCYSSTTTATTRGSAEQNNSSSSPIRRQQPAPTYRPVCELVQEQEELLGYCDSPSGEWDRDALLDPEWEAQQKRTFTAWCNSHLRKAGTTIHAIDTDFQTGLKLMLLLEVISGEQLPRPDRGRMRFHRIANVNKALEFIESKGVKLVSIGAEEVVDGNVKMTLGLIWTIILRFAIQEISVGELSARDGLLLWCQRKTQPYPNVEVRNFSTSWRDGLAFCALIHRHHPELIDYTALGADNAVGNLNLAFDVAERHLDIPRMLDAEILASAAVLPDEKAVMTYVSCYYHKFVNQSKSALAVNRITRVLKALRESERLAAEAQQLAKELTTWCNRKSAWMRQRPTTAYDDMEKNHRRSSSNHGKAGDQQHSLEEMKACLAEFHSYVGDEKPRKEGELARLGDVVQKLKHNNAANSFKQLPSSSIIPHHLDADTGGGLLVEGVQAAWSGMEEAEPGFEAWILAEIQRLDHIAKLVEKFRSKAAAHREWMKGRIEILGDINHHSHDHHLSSPAATKKWQSPYELRAKIMELDSHDSDSAAHQERVDQLVTIAEELGRLRNSSEIFDEIHAECARVSAEWSSLGELSAAQRTRLEGWLAVAEKLDANWRDFSRRATLFKQWLDSVGEDLADDSLMVYSLAEAEELMRAHEEFVATLPDAERGLGEIVEIEEECARLIEEQANSSLFEGPSPPTNPYTRLASDALVRSWQAMRSLVPRRETQLRQEVAKQVGLEARRAEFERRLGQVEGKLATAIENHDEGENENFEDWDGLKSAMRQLEESYAQLQAVNIQAFAVNPNEANSSQRPNRERRSLEQLENGGISGMQGRMTAVRRKWQKTRAGSSSSTSPVAKARHHRTGTELDSATNKPAVLANESRLAECRASFEHFDRDHCGELDEAQLKACLISLGYFDWQLLQEPVSSTGQSVAEEARKGGGKSHYPTESNGTRNGANSNKNGVLHRGKGGNHQFSPPTSPSPTTMTELENTDEMRRIMGKCDPEARGRVPLEAFLHFMLSSDHGSSGETWAGDGCGEGGEEPLGSEAGHLSAEKLIEAFRVLSTSITSNSSKSSSSTSNGGVKNGGGKGGGSEGGGGSPKGSGAQNGGPTSDHKGGGEKNTNRKHLISSAQLRAELGAELGDYCAAKMRFEQDEASDLLGGSSANASHYAYFDYAAFARSLF